MAKTIVIGNKKYSIDINVSSMNHLCTFREVSNYKLTVSKKNPRFNEYEIYSNRLDEDELNLVSAMLARECVDNVCVNGDVKGFLASMSTGTSFRWSYTKEQKKVFKPIFDLIGADSSMVLYEYDDIELTMFNFNIDRLRSLSEKLETYTNVIKSKLPEEEQIEVPSAITEEAIREYLRQVN